MATPQPVETSPLTSLTAETAPVLDQHRFDEAALTRYMAEHVEAFSPPLAVGQVRGGMSNPTFILTDAAGRRYVLRKKPPGKLLPSAHAVDREFRPPQVRPEPHTSTTAQTERQYPERAVAGW